MTIDEAIKHCEEVGNGAFCENHKDCGEEHKQLAEWLKELKKARAKLKAIEIRIKSMNVIDLDIDSSQCPMCGVDLDKREEYAYCPDCGQALTWGYFEEEEQEE